MPVIGLGLHFAVAIVFAVHAVRSGQDRYWLFILFMFPLLGSLVYALAIWLPEMRHSRGARRIVRGVRDMIDPGRELREAQEAFEVAATADNRLRLADALLAAGRADDAVRCYEAALRGVHSDDPHIQVRLAQALLEAGRAQEARDLLDALIRERPDFKSAEGHLTYARAVAATGDRARAKEEFEALVGYYAGFEARARYAQLLSEWGEDDAARVLRNESLRQANRLPRYARVMNKEWIEQLQRLA